MKGPRNMFIQGIHDCDVLGARINTCLTYHFPDFHLITLWCLACFSCSPMPALDSLTSFLQSLCFSVLKVRKAVYHILKPLSDSQVPIFGHTQSCGAWPLFVFVEKWLPPKAMSVSL